MRLSIMSVHPAISNGMPDETKNMLPGRKKKKPRYGIRAGFLQILNCTGWGSNLGPLIHNTGK
jgi:hypothetical protein